MSDNNVTLETQYSNSACTSGSTFGMVSGDCNKNVCYKWLSR